MSGEPPQDPVISKTSGNIFERRLIETYIEGNHKDPITGEELSLSDLLDVKTNKIVRPRPPSLTSIPSLLSTFQAEWDALALEVYGARQQLHQTRQELSSALYQHDAACRVIARLIKERDEARTALSQVSIDPDVQKPRETKDAEDAHQKISPAVLSIVDDTHARFGPNFCAGTTTNWVDCRLPAGSEKFQLIGPLRVKFRVSRWRLACPQVRSRLLQ